MAKKTEVITMIDSFKEFKETKNIDRSTLISVLEEVFHIATSRLLGADGNYDIIVNPDTGDCEIARNRIVVADGAVTDKNKEISLSEAKQLDDSYELDEEVSDKVQFSSFGRRAILYLRQALSTKIQELENDSLFTKYSERIGTIVTAEVYQSWKKEAILHDNDGNELTLPKTEQISSDFFRKGDTLRAVIDRVENRGSAPRIILSRTSPLFLEKMLEQEVPEIIDGLITIKKVARIPGERAKVAVESYDERIDPVGACVGVKGSRVRGIVKEMHGENIDVINYTQNTSLFIQRALGPITISNLTINEDEKRVDVLLRPEEISAAIGRNGANIKLASMLTGYTIEIFRDVPEEEIEEEDVLLDEFKDVIDEWIIDAIKAMGIDTAKGVLKAPKQMLIEKADIEEDTADEIYRILSAEFEEA